MSGATHFIGISGAGLSAIARVLLERGERVTGSDQVLTEQSRALQQEGALISIGHQTENVNGAARVIRSSAITDENVEVQRALEKGIPVYKRSEALGAILAGKRVLAVAGSHGKTTTSAMLAWMLTAIGQAPGYIVGSDLTNTGRNAAAGESDLFVIEADEYDYMFLGLTPALALITNVEADHPDMFPTRESFFDAFRQFVDRIPDEGQLIYCADDAGASEIAGYARMRGKRVAAYSIGEAEAEYRGNALEAGPGGYRFSLAGPETQLETVELQIPGRHNAQNAVGALAAVDALGLSASQAAAALADFQGTGRRFQIIGEAGGVMLVDDYAHHPSEITATLEAAREAYPERRVWAVWQPHTFSRTTLLWDQFLSSLKAADKILLLPVFAAREQAPEGFDLLAKLSQSGLAEAAHCPDFEEANAYLLDQLQPGDIALVLSAGDATQLSEQLLKSLKERA